MLYCYWESNGDLIGAINLLSDRARGEYSLGVGHAWEMKNNKNYLLFTFKPLKKGLNFYYLLTIMPFDTQQQE